MNTTPEDKCWCGEPAEYVNEATDATPEHVSCEAHVKDGYRPINLTTTSYLIYRQEPQSAQGANTPGGVVNAPRLVARFSYTYDKTSATYGLPMRDVMIEWEKRATGGIPEGIYWVGEEPIPTMPEGDDDDAAEVWPYSIVLHRVTVTHYSSIW